MIRDFSTAQQLPSWDVCIAGAGPAGIAMARELAAAGLRVGLLEGGGLTYSEQSQRLYQVESTGMDLFAASTRLRYFGGTSNHWSGRCRPFEADDFSRPPQGGLPGWPITFEEFDQYRPAAMRLLDLPAAGFQPLNAPLVGGRFEADPFALSPPTRFAAKYLDELKASKHIDLVLNCNLVEVLFAAGTQSVAGFRVVNHQRQGAVATAKNYVLAMGAIENVRLLLNSHALMAAGVGGPTLGKGFMEHLNVEFGTFVSAEADAPQGRQYFAGEVYSKQQSVGKGNVSFNVLSDIKSYGRTAEIKSFLKNLACDLGLADKVQFITRFNCPGSGVISTLLEQMPVLDGSRISLSNERDALGLQKAKVHWTLSAHDRRTVREVALQVAKDFAESGLGFVKLHDYLLDPAAAIPVAPHAHHMGGTRMAAHQRDGVVNPDARVFGANNLYVAGSSVFATGGGGNPTMPLLQLALRLAKHLSSRG